ncbi:SDR family NAD(P)-dependent oxidoreductase [Nocardiopsis sp. RSe5-2]|uniref:SDR family NAD(P)-dependent oxidoreductase n=1 Tax=Nocardiopsis endophytica TaxID=3018445 RepID=A0ABT4U0U6_9ACTN|nr:SDR family NAD(P)-dependent oxidoreductase [Nocardiopsis endophytica]MDA2810564.1 SDR family NAD(P)-dependent oxidoreductase [Nocardiopsis endophytica]
MTTAPPDPGGLSGLVVLVTGAASGIGAAVAALAAERGATPVLLDRDRDGVQERVDALPAHGPPGGPALALAADVTDEASVRSAVGAALHRLGRIDTVVTCAGVSGPVGSRLEEVALTDWQRVFAVNVTGAYLTLKHTLASQRRSPHGAAVLVASDSALVAAPGMVPYCASKAAVVQLARALSVETADEVRVNAVCPSVVDTPMSRGDLQVPDFTGAGYPVHRPEDVAEHVLFLASPRAAGIHGAAVTLDFGYSARSAFPA